MKRRLLTLAVLLATATLLAAAPKARVKGLVTDGANGRPMEWATVVVTNLNDRIIGKADVSDGQFLVEDLPAGDALLLVRLMGYEAYISEKLTLRSGQTLDIGTIELRPLSRGLQEVTVQGERNQIIYKLDRQSISAASSVTASSGTAVDVLSGTPSVMVDADGNLTFRGSSNFLVYVDGKPSPLDGTAALKQIPAGNIEDVEIITTPSARYKTEGGVGIINITTRRSQYAGWSGLVNASAGTLGTWSGDAVLNYRAGRHNVYVGGTMQNIKGKSEFTQEKTTMVNDIETRSLSDGKRWSRNGTYTARTGWQYADDRHHNLSLDMLCGTTSNWRGGDMDYQEIRDNGLLSMVSNYDSHDRYNLRKNLFQASLDYVWTLSKHHQLALNNRFRHDWYSIEYTESNMFTPQGARYEGTRGYEEEHHWDCDGSLAYRFLYSKTGRLEAGYQYTTYSEHGGYKIKYWNRPAQAFQWQDDLATPFYYRRQVHSPYLMLNDHLGPVTFDAGLRADRVLDELEIEIVGADRDIKRFDLFPSAHLSYETEKAGTFNAGYSYRTNRPGIWTLEPYITYEDYYTKKKGNPDIKPEYAHSAEAGWFRPLKGGHTLSATAYYRYRRDISDWVRRPYEPGVTLDSIVNAGNQQEYGLEAAAALKPTRWWNSNLGGSIFNYRFRSHSEVCTDNDGWQYLINWANIFSVARATKLQFDTHIIGPKILTQGREKAYCYFDLAASQQLLRGRMSISLVAHDIFHTARYYNTRHTAGLTSITQVRPRYPNILLSVSYNFNSSSHKANDVSSGALFEGKDF